MTISSKKFLDLVKSLNFYAPLKNGKSHYNRRHFGSRPRCKGQGSGDHCDVTSRTQQSVFRTISHHSLVTFGRLNRFRSQICRTDVLLRVAVMSEAWRTEEGSIRYRFTAMSVQRQRNEGRDG